MDCDCCLHEITVLMGLANACVCVCVRVRHYTPAFPHDEHRTPYLQGFSVVGSIIITAILRGFLKDETLAFEVRSSPTRGDITIPHFSNCRRAHA